MNPIRNEDLPCSSTLLPGSAPFHNHPGYDAAECPLREVVVAKTGVTNNGFRCFMTGGHCLPGPSCAHRRERFARERVDDNTMIVIQTFRPDSRGVAEANRLAEFLKSKGIRAEVYSDIGEDVLIREIDTLKYADLVPTLRELFG
ncbi:hypothetical protein H1O16_gp154 [Burkholderia phage BcepSaruman]|uniref:Uncharacterized protein n=1 Tax=Burkholderia phage BcepSaruman TaxID=2530032 RepID=A0A4D5ZE80_9CAUD|nr:hypothetical protein H1O16_gp154 [Burkholderia phage BcepSaruman]QBX06567.1 hypothetical protein BcepSaruman_154 [Burkholderia phage BcepSaruman]